MHLTSRPINLGFGLWISKYRVWFNNLKNTEVKGIQTLRVVWLVPWPCGHKSPSCMFPPGSAAAPLGNLPTTPGREHPPSWCPLVDGLFAHSLKSYCRPTMCQTSCIHSMATETKGCYKLLPLGLMEDNECILIVLLSPAPCTVSGS